MYMTVDERSVRLNKLLKRRILKEIIVSSCAAGGFFSFPSAYLLILLLTRPKNIAGVLMGYLILAILIPIYIFGIRVIIIVAHSVVGMSSGRIYSNLTSIEKCQRLNYYKIKILIMQQKHEAKKSRKDRKQQDEEKILQSEVKYAFQCKDSVRLSKNNSDGNFKVGDTAALILSSQKFEPSSILYGFIDDGTADELVRKIGTQKNKPLAFMPVFIAILILSIVVLFLILALFYLILLAKYRP